jgi:hypothetical protein
MTAEQADAFTGSATEAINSALEYVRETKNSLDSFTRELAGEEATADAAADPLAVEPTDSEPTDPDAVAADQNLMEPQPLGRGKR